jgi:hypothetical protein
MPLRAYMASAEESKDGAVLVFAENWRSARTFAWKESELLQDICNGEFLSLRVHQLKAIEFQWLFALKTKEGPEVIDYVPSCKTCNQWGSLLNADSNCDSCSEYVTEGGIP